MAIVDIENMTTKDEVIQEARKIKDDLAKAFAYDMKKMLDAPRMRQHTSGRTVLSPPTNDRS